MFSYFFQKNIRHVSRKKFGRREYETQISCVTLGSRLGVRTTGSMLRAPAAAVHTVVSLTLARPGGVVQTTVVVGCGSEVGVWRRRRRRRRRGWRRRGGGGGEGGGGRDGGQGGGGCGGGVGGDDRWPSLNRAVAAMAAASWAAASWAAVITVGEGSGGSGGGEGGGSTAAVAAARER